ncbi:alpha-protein kinase 3 [Boleophthalmus pectinirostris]|uniref:alpha-protein kinase 3 n=1 Tax=Boleophthalmus pectinirostris TaxID=150288 RepID=UPI00242C108C|nr:alpha-protein kinase 3 [Boleophthalmus pectinirostris]
MGSRRTMNRSLSGNGRSLNGTEVRGSSRPPGCSYLSSVRPENRSTLCSVIAQLTEETQPFFEVTLKSRAVSESCNVKFTCVVTGYPAPQITWYKDDIQLDRYCGLPKYEIFRNGQNHSLHIYNCTEEDAAIYQASAINTKGIVSCSGVLEVGEMNEFKIHQRYFSKLKQKAENKRREAEEKENQEPERTISPDRAQRKRRSTVGGYISAPSSTEEDTGEAYQQETSAEVKAKVQESSVEEVKDTNRTMESIESHLLNGQDSKENTPSPGIHITDSAQKMFTAQPKTLFGKKLKISNPAKADPEETNGHEKEVKASLAGSELPKSPKKTKHLMDVENSATSTSVLPSFKSLKRRVTSIGGKQGLSQEKVDHKTPKENVKVQNGSPSNNPSPMVPPRASKLQLPQPTIKQDNSTTPKVIDRDKKAQGLSPDMTPHTDTSCDSGTALPQPPCQQVRQEPAQRETRPDQKRGRMPTPVQKREATQAQAKTQRNEAPVDLELKPKLHTTVEAETPPSETTEQDRRGLSLHSGLHKAMDNMSQDTQDHSRGSGEICVGLLADTQKPPLKSSTTAENKSKCNVPPGVQQSQPNMPIKTTEGTDIQLHEKVKGQETNSLTSPSTGGAQSEEDKMSSAEKARNIDEMAVNLSQEEKECKGSVKSLQVSSRGHSLLQPEENTQITNKTDMFLESEPKDLQKCSSPIPNIISIAELLRSQINALEESISSRIAQVDNRECPTGRGVGSESNTTNINKDVLIDKSPPQTIKETLMQIYNELIKTKELFVEEAPVLSNCTQPLESVEIPSSVTPEKTIYSEINEHKATNCLSETGLPLKDREEEPPNDESVHDTDTQAVTKQPPVLKLDCVPVVEVREMFAAPLTYNSNMDEPKSNTSSLENVQELPVPSASDSVGILQKNNNLTEDTEKAVILPHLILDISPMLEKRDCDSIPSATPQELASGARRKIPTHKTKLEEVEPPTANNDFNPVSVSTSPRLCRHSALLQPNVEPASPKKKRSPLLSRKKSPVEIQSPQTPEPPDIKSEECPANKNKNDPYRAPQVIRKIRGETFADHSGNMKLWCQFFNVLSESTVTWYRDELVIAKMLKSAGDETKVNLALAQATSLDTGVYGCTITNEYGTDSTDFLLSAEVLSGMSLQEDLGVGEEIELTPLIFNKGVADSCVWGNKLFGRIMVQESRLGGGFSHKTWRAKVIYGLEPVFESGNLCIIKVCNPIVYGGKGEGLLIEKNQEGVQQVCKIQNLVREYCKIFSAEARAIESFGSSLEVIPVYLMYRPANSIPYCTVETDLKGEYSRYCGMDHTGRLDMRSGSEVEQKCCALLHWIFQWTSGNMLFTKLEGVDFKITNVGISVKSHGHQGLPLEGNPKVFEQFVTQHQCNYFCGLLGLRSLKVIESLLMPTKPKGSKSPLVQRKMGTGSSSPQAGRKTSASPRIPKKIQQDGQRTPSEQKLADESMPRIS